MTEQAAGTGIDAIECMYTARSTRRFADRPVPIEVLSRIVEMATMAPSAENKQTWRFVVLTDREPIAMLGKIYAEIFSFAGPAVKPTLDPGIFASVDHLATHFGESPAVVVIGALGPAPDATMVVAQATWWGSVLPAVQNLILAARAEGVGATLTTLPLARDADIRAAIGAPDDLTLAAVVPLGYPKGGFGRPARKPVTEVAFLNRWGTPLPAPGS